MSETNDRQPTRVAAIYARVSSERQRQEETIQSQLGALRELGVMRLSSFPKSAVLLRHVVACATML